MASTEAINEAFEGYAEEERLLGPHALQALTWASVVCGLLAYAARSGRLEDRVSAADVALLGITTHKISRIVTRTEVMNFLRAPFTKYEGPRQLNEVNQQPKGVGLSRAMGELLACPLCIGTWIAGGLMCGLAYAPRFTRAIETTFAGVAISDLLHVLYAEAIERAS
ncbi:MAG: DUF1360 domain-containing protein [Acidobacteria bacterium]|nr:DUF1360 domain-containing protein [Acidobacteriota bacterium]